jgi:hypothetical protein
LTAVLYFVTAISKMREKLILLQLSVPGYGRGAVLVVSKDAAFCLELGWLPEPNAERLWSAVTPWTQSLPKDALALGG